MEDLGIEQKIFIPVKERAFADVSGSYTYFADGDVLLAKITPCFENGKVGIAENLINGIGFGSSEFIVFRPTEVLSNQWLYYFVSRESFREEGAKQMTGAVGHKRVSKEFIENYQIPIPPLPEQQRIVAILDEAFDGIATAKANAEKNLKNARELFESYLQSIFTQRGEGWKLKNLDEIAITFGRGKSKHRPRGDIKLLGGAYPLIQTGEVANSNHFIIEYSQTYSEFGLAQSKLWPKGTVCIAIVGANVAETAILDFDACFPDSVIGIVVNEELADNEYVEFLLQSFKSILKERGKGTARDNINMGTFENQKFPFPDVIQQKRIAGKINSLAEETQRLESICQQKFNALEELKKSLLHKAFSGQL